MNLLVRDANFRNRNRNRFRYGIGFFVVCFANLAPLLRCIIFFRQTHLGAEIRTICLRLRLEAFWTYLSIFFNIGGKGKLCRFA